MKHRKCLCLSGSVTVLCCLMLLICISLFLAVMDLISVQGGRMLSMTGASAAADGLAAQYDADLLEQYELFFLDGTFGGMGFSAGEAETVLEEYARRQFRPNEGMAKGSGQWYFQVDVKKASLDNMSYATDGKGAAFRRQAVAYMKKQWLADAAGSVLDAVHGNPVPDDLESDYENRQKNSEESIKKAEEEAKAQRETEMQQGEMHNGQGGAPADSVTEAVPIAGNPLEILKQIKERGILQLVLKDPAAVSQRRTDVTQMVSRRKYADGAGTKGERSMWEEGLDRLYFAQYAVKKFPSYAVQEKTALDKGNRGLRYQMEYILQGKDSDVENLKAVVHSLLLVREGLNFAYLLTDTGKQAQAEGAAAALAGATGTWPLIAAYRYGILLAWAYGESILDVRSLLAGGTLCPVKTAKYWQLSLENLGQLLEGAAAEGTVQDNGWSYEDYVRTLFYGMDQEIMTMRCLDMIEQNVRSQPGRESFQADCLVYTGQVSMETVLRRWRGGSSTLTVTVPFEEYAYGTSGR